MFVRYGVVDLDVISVRQWDRRAVYDAARKNVLHETILRVRAYFNPGATAYRLFGAYGAFNPTPLPNRRAPGGGVLGGPPPSWAGQTEDSLRSYMLAARRQLTVTVPDATTAAGGRGREVLVAPARRPDNPNAFYATDARNGPLPLDFKILKWHGSKTAEVEWAVVVANANDCHYFDRDPPVLISHVYRMEDRTSREHLTTRVITGEATFRTDRLALLNQRPDAFRAQLFFPVPANMQRVEVNVTPLEGGDKIRYRVVDQEKMFNSLLNDFNVTHVEAFYTNATTSRVGAEDLVMDVLQIGTSTAERAADATLRGGQFSSLVGRPDEAVAVAAVIGTAVAHGVMQAVNAAWKAAPRLRRGLTVKMWGNRDATRKGLLDAAMRVYNFIISDKDFVAPFVGGFVNKIIPIGPANKVFADFVTGVLGDPANLFSAGTFGVVEHLTGKYVEMNVDIEMGPQQTAMRRAFALGQNTSVYLMGPDEIGDVTTSDPKQANILPPLDGHTRGTLVAALVSQALADPCDGIKAPAPAPNFRGQTFGPPSSL